jgi:signal transduction histidine kinase
VVFDRNRFTNSQFDWRRVSIALIDRNDQIIYGQGDFRVGDPLPPRRTNPALRLELDGKMIGQLVLRTKLPPASYRSPGSPEDQLLQRLVGIIFYSTLGAVLLALLLGAILARSLTKPIRELTAATAAVAAGELGAQVPVRSRDELGQLAASFNHMSSDLAHANELRRQMTADVAHDLRTPLSLLLGYTEALNDGKLRGNSTTYAVMHDAAQQLQGLVNDLNTLAQVDAGELPLMRRAVDPRALLERTALAFMSPAQDKGVTLSIAAAEDLPAIFVDPERMTQVLTNLVANALRYTPTGGSVTLAAEVETRTDAAGAEGVLLRVSDTGTGIAPEHLPYIFDRFYRGDRSRQTQTGEAGLGLAIARSIVESHEGTIGVASVEGQGSTFTIHMPTAPTEDRS